MRLFVVLVQVDVGSQCDKVHGKEGRFVVLVWKGAVWGIESKVDTSFKETCRCLSSPLMGMFRFVV
jgi:hypothetical protein